jgi:excisionase family DNA binding protein
MASRSAKARPQKRVMRPARSAKAPPQKRVVRAARSAKAPLQKLVVRPVPADKRLGRRVGPAWLTVSQLSRRWQLARKTIYKFIDAQELPAWKVGSHLYRIAVEDVLRFEARNRRPRE